MRVCQADNGLPYPPSDNGLPYPTPDQGSIYPPTFHNGRQHQQTFPTLPFQPSLLPSHRLLEIISFPPQKLHQPPSTRPPFKSPQTKFKLQNPTNLRSHLNHCKTTRKKKKKKDGQKAQKQGLALLNLKQARLRLKLRAKQKPGKICPQKRKQTKYQRQTENQNTWKALRRKTNRKCLKYFSRES